jgi:hypothetical protein
MGLAETYFADLPTGQEETDLKYPEPDQYIVVSTGDRPSRVFSVESSEAFCKAINSLDNRALYIMNKWEWKQEQKVNEEEDRRRNKLVMLCQTV